MNHDSLPLYLRAHAESFWDNSHSGYEGRPSPDKYPEYALVFDCETTLDTSQAFVLACYRVCRRNTNASYFCVEEGIVFADEATAEERSTVRKYGRKHKSDAVKGYSSRIRVLSRSKFIQRVFYKLAYDLEGLVCGFNLPFDLTRLALDARTARRNKGWSLVMSQYKDKKTGCMKENRFRSRIILTPKDTDPSSLDTSSVADIQGTTPVHQGQLRSHLELAHEFSWDLNGYFVDRLPAPMISSYTRLDSQLRWRFTEGAELSVIGQNLLRDHHAEFNDQLQSVNSSLIKRSVYAKLTLRF